MKLSVTFSPHCLDSSPVLFSGHLEEVFHFARENGFQGIELHLQNPDEVNKRTVRRLLTTYELEVPTIGTGMAATQEGLVFTSIDRQIQKAAVRRIYDHIELAHELQSGVTIGLIFGSTSGPAEQRQLQQRMAFECLSECIKKAEEESVTLFLEPVNRYESNQLNNLDDVIQVMSRCSSTNIKMLADTFHMNIEESDPMKSVRRHIASIGHLHLADSNRQAPGFGHFDFCRLFQALANSGYQGYGSFEILPKPDSRNAALSGRAHVQQCLANQEHQRSESQGQL